MLPLGIVASICIMETTSRARGARGSEHCPSRQPSVPLHWSTFFRVTRLLRTGLPAFKFASVTPAMAGQRPGSPLMSRAVQVPPQACRPVPVRLLRDGPSHSSGTAGPRLGRTADVTHLALSLALVLAIPVRSTESR